MLALALAAIAGAWSAEADLPVEDWCGLADLVAVAEVTSSEVEWTTAPEGGLATRWWLAVARVVKGRAGDTLEVVLPGGARDGVTQWISDVPVLGVDRTFVVLLAWRDGAWAPAVGSRSAIPVARHPKEPWPTVPEVLGALGDCP